MFKKIYAVFRISRPINVLITFLTILLAGIICSANNHFGMNIILASLSGMFVLAGGNVINDFFDFETDKINRPQRVLPQKDLTKKEVLILYVLLLIFSTIVASKVNFAALITVIFTNIFLFLYSYKFKRISLVGNILISFFTGLAFIYGGIAVNNWKSGLFPALFAFLINLIREILKDAEDIKGDKKTGIVTFPQKYNYRTTINLISILALILIFSTTLPYFFKLYRIEYFIIVMATVNVILVYIIRKLYTDYFLANIRKLNNLLKLDMLLGLFAIFVGTYKLI